MTCVPVPAGSNDGSPAGTGMFSFSVVPLDVRSRSWSRNWPQIHVNSDSSRLLTSDSVWLDSALLTARAEGRDCPAGDETPSGYAAGAVRSRSVLVLPHVLWARLLPVPSTL